MTDYISREAAIEAMYELCNKDQRQIFTREQLLALDDVPAADVREVVYCKDCLHFSYDDVEGGWCDEWGKEVGSPNFYCADADMREEQT